MIRKLSDNSKEYIEKYLKNIENIKEKLSKIEIDGCICKIYINQSLILKESLLDLCENILKYTTNSNIETFAKLIMEEFEKEGCELGQMQEYCCNFENDSRDVFLYQKRFEILFENLILALNNMPATNNLDLGFVGSVNQCLEFKINMAKNVLGYEICENLRACAEEAITVYEMLLSQSKRFEKMI